MPGQDCGLRFEAFDQRSHKIDSHRPASGTDESPEMWWSCSRRSTISFCKLTTSPVVNCGRRIRVAAISSCRRKLAWTRPFHQLSATSVGLAGIFCINQAETRPSPSADNCDIKEGRLGGSWAG